MFELIVQQALAGAPWRTTCADPMQLNFITADEVEEEVKRRGGGESSACVPRKPIVPQGSGSIALANIRDLIFEVIVQQALAGAPWRTICAGPMQLNFITPDEVEAEVKWRGGGESSAFVPRKPIVPEGSGSIALPLPDPEPEQAFFMKHEITLTIRFYSSANTSTDRACPSSFQGACADHSTGTPRQRTDQWLPQRL